MKRKNNGVPEIEEEKKAKVAGKKKKKKKAKTNTSVETDTTANKSVKKEKGYKGSPKEKKVKTTGLLRFRKVGAGVFRHQGHIYKENEMFLAKFKDIPKAFLNQIVCLEPEKLVALKEGKEEIVSKTKPDRSIFSKQATNGGLFNIVNNLGKLMNEAPLSEEEAESMLDILNP